VASNRNPLIRDVLVIIDSPGFTHRVARQVRARALHIPIVDLPAITASTAFFQKSWGAAGPLGSMRSWPRRLHVGF
jgi:hypothetical protein